MDDNERLCIVKHRTVMSQILLLVGFELGNSCPEVGSTDHSATQNLLDNEQKLLNKTKLKGYSNVTDQSIGILTLLLLNRICPVLANSVHLDQLTSEDDCLKQSLNM